MSALLQSRTFLRMFKVHQHKTGHWHILKLIDGQTSVDIIQDDASKNGDWRFAESIMRMMAATTERQSLRKGKIKALQDVYRVDQREIRIL